MLLLVALENPGGWCYDIQQMGFGTILLTAFRVVNRLRSNLDWLLCVPTFCGSSVICRSFRTTVLTAGSSESRYVIS